jgi:hypothetical protein
LAQLLNHPSAAQSALQEHASAAQVLQQMFLLQPTLEQLHIKLCTSPVAVPVPTSPRPAEPGRDPQPGCGRGRGYTWAERKAFNDRWTEEEWAEWSKKKNDRRARWAGVNKEEVQARMQAGEWVTFPRVEQIAELQMQQVAAAAAEPPKDEEQTAELQMQQVEQQEPVVSC